MKSGNKGSFNYSSIIIIPAYAYANQYTVT
jgi:hypothetical protein